MKTLNTYAGDKEVSVNHANFNFAGRGRYNIEVELIYAGNQKTFKSSTTDLEAIDEVKEQTAASELFGEEKYEKLYDLITSDIEESVIEWIYDTEENED